MKTNEEKIAIYMRCPKEELCHMLVMVAPNGFADLIEISHPIIDGKFDTKGDQYCEKCGAKNPCWYTENELWNKTIGESAGVLCPLCFQRIADEKKIVGIFKFELI